MLIREGVPAAEGEAAMGGNQRKKQLHHLSYNNMARCQCLYICVCVCRSSV